VNSAVRSKDYTASNGLDSRLVGIVSPRSREAEQYRKLRYMVEVRKDPMQGIVVGITSPGPGDGKSTTAANLAGVLCQNGENSVLLVDADIRRQSAFLKQAFKLKRIPENGLSQAVSVSSPSLSPFIKKIKDINLSIMFCGLPLKEPYEVFRSPRFAQILRNLRSQFDYIIVDTPPVSLASESQIICNMVDAVFVVVRAHQTSKEMLAETLDTLGSETPISLVFNSADESVGKYYGYYNW
jgi:capsular exopolysaccharide synthesis family protein